MSAALMPTTQPMPTLHWPSRTWLRHALAMAVAAGLHAVVVVGLVGQWQTSTPPEPQVQTLTTQLITLAPPQPPAPEPVVAAPVVAPPEVLAEPPKPAPAKPVEAKPKLPPKPAIDHAALARKRVQEREQQVAEQQAQQQRIEQQRIEAQRQQAAAQAQAEAKARAAAQALAADSRTYQPISKQAPEYPQKALDKGIEGDCTVTYTVTAQGRVDNPQVLGECHPLLVRPSLAAARTFRYQPRIVDGQAISVANVKNTFHYRIE